MKIHFSNVNFSSSSGPNTFAFRLANQLVKEGHEIVNYDKEYDIYLCFIEPNTPYNGKAKFIHRLDGIWTNPETFVEKNASIKKAYDFADCVVWQSEFDKNMTLKHWGTPKSGKIIHNGINIENKKEENLHPDIAKIKNSFDRVFVCSASWHRQKRLKENIELYNKIRNDKDALLILGNNPDYIQRDRNVFYLGHMPHEICLQIYSIASWFIHLAWIDHCPNVVVEALSQNCPVICSDSGGTKEIVGSNGVMIPEKNPYNFELVDYDKPFDIDIEINDLPNIVVKNSHLDIELVYSKYMELFTR